MEETEFFNPLWRGKGVVGEVRHFALVLGEKYEEGGLRLKLKTYPDSLSKLNKILSSHLKREEKI